VQRDTIACGLHPRLTKHAWYACVLEAFPRNVLSNKRPTLVRLIVYSYLSHQDFAVWTYTAARSLHQTYQQPESRCEHSKGSQQQRCLASSVPADGRQQGCWRSGSRTDRHSRSLSYSMLEQYRLPVGQEHHSRPAGTDTDTDTDSVQREEHRAKKNNTKRTRLLPPSATNLPTQIEPTRGPMRGQPIAVRQSGPHRADRLRLGILRDLPPLKLSQEDSIFKPPVFMFPHGSPCYPRHPSAWFNLTWTSSSVLCRSAAVMFDAAKVQQSPPHRVSFTSTTHTSPSTVLAKHPSHNCLPRCSSNQTLCSHPELPTHLMSPTNTGQETREILRFLL